MAETKEQKTWRNVARGLSNLTGLSHYDFSGLTYAEAFDRAIAILDEYQLLEDPRAFLISYGISDPETI